MNTTSPGRAERPRGGIRRAASDPVSITFVAIILLASFLRLWQLGSNGLSGDEAVYAGQAAVLAGDHAYSRYFILISRGNSNFLLFQEIVSLFFRLFGVGDLIPRLVSAVFGVGLVVVVYAMGRLMMGRRAALVPMLLIAVSSYAVALARLALLDTCAAFFMALAVLLFMLWAREADDPARGRRAAAYLAAFAAAAVLACEAKVTSILLLPIVVAYLALSRSYRHLSRMALIWATLAGLVALVPVLLQVALHAESIKAALSTSVERNSPVPWTYYLEVLRSYEGLPVLIGVSVALLCAMWQRRAEDLLAWLWLIASAAFLELYPLKAGNYLLIVVVPLALLGGAGVVRVLRLLRDRAAARRPAVVVVLAVLLLAGAGTAQAATRLDAQLASVQNPGIRAVAAWLDAHTSRNAGVMVLSQGSAQYAVAFYAHRDSYPFGRFRLATVLPGGQIQVPQATPNGQPPTDWVTTYPNQYVQDGKVTYFVFGLPEQDDPSELSFAGLHVTQRNYLALIQSYGGKVVDLIHTGHHDEVFIFAATRRELVTRLSYQAEQSSIVLRATGFASGEPLTVYYHDKRIASGYANAQGDATIVIGYPAQVEPSWRLVVTDSHGRYASASGLAVRR